MLQDDKQGMNPKRNNKIRIARYISSQGTTSKTEISSGLKLSMPTTLQNVNALIREGIVEETGEYESTGGRKAKALSIRGDIGYSIGVDITNNHITMVLVNARKEIVKSVRLRVSYENSLDYNDILIKTILEFIKREEIHPSKIEGVGFSLPGIMDQNQKILLRSHTLKVENISFRTIGETLGFPYGIENDANSAAFAEMENRPDYGIYLSLSNTVGGAIYLGHHLYAGDNFKSGEFGHMVIEKTGKKCYCGKQGCMDAYCSALVLEHSADCSLDQFFERLKKQDSDIMQIWDEYLDNLAVAVTNLRMIFDCKIVLGGYVGGYLTEFMPDLARKVMKYNNFDVDTSYLSAGKYKLNAAAYGAALRFIDHIFDKI